MEPSLDQCSEAFQFHTVLDRDVEGVIQSFSSHKTPGHDRVSVRVLKCNVLLKTAARIYIYIYLPSHMESAHDPNSPRNR